MLVKGRVIASGRVIIPLYPGCSATPQGFNRADVNPMRLGHRCRKNEGCFWKWIGKWRWEAYWGWVRYLPGRFVWSRRVSGCELRGRLGVRKGSHAVGGVYCSGRWKDTTVKSHECG